MKFFILSTLLLSMATFAQLNGPTTNASGNTTPLPYTSIPGTTQATTQVPSTVNGSIPGTFTTDNPVFYSPSEINMNPSGPVQLPQGNSIQAQEAAPVSPLK